MPSGVKVCANGTSPSATQSGNGAYSDEADIGSTTYFNPLRTAVENSMELKPDVARFAAILEEDHGLAQKQWRRNSERTTLRVVVRGGKFGHVGIVSLSEHIKENGFFE